jgi:hypothetical protein
MDQLVGFRAIPARRYLTMPDLPDEPPSLLPDLIDRARQQRETYEITGTQAP